MVDSIVPPTEVGDFTIEDFSRATIEQDHGTVHLYVEHDDSGDIVAEETSLYTWNDIEIVADEYRGDFTIYWYDYDGDGDLDVDIGIVQAPVIADFGAESGDLVTITQDNDTGASIDILVESQGEMIHSEDGLTTSGSTDFIMSYDGAGLVRWYNTDGIDESEDNLTIEIDVDEPEELTTIDVGADEDGSVVRFGHDHDSDVEFQVINEDTGEFVAEGTIDDEQIYPVVGVEPGQHRFISHDDVDFDDVDFETELVEPTNVDDFGATYSGTSSDGWFSGDNDYYLVEVEETTTKEIVLTNTGTDEGSVGFARSFVFGQVNEELARTHTYVNNAGTSVTQEFEFEAGQIYVIRIGGTFDSPSSAWTYNYDLTFD